MFDVEFRQAPGPDPDHNKLTEPADHETAGVLRMFRGGIAPPMICSLLRISKTQLMHEMNLAIDDEAEATRRSVKVVGDNLPAWKAAALLLSGR